MIRLILAAAIFTGCGGGICAWTYIVGRRTRAQAARLAITRHPAARRTHPDTPGLPVDGEPLDDREKRAFDRITAVRQQRRRVLVIPEDTRRLLTPREVQGLFRVGAKAVRAWVAAGHLTEVPTPGGARRFSETEVLAHLRASETPMIVSAGAAGEVALPEAQRPAGSEVWPPALPLAGRMEGGAGKGTSGAPGGRSWKDSARTPPSRTEEGSRR